MENTKKVLVFDATEFAKTVSIGDELLLTAYSGEYCLFQSNNLIGVESQDYLEHKHLIRFLETTKKERMVINKASIHKCADRIFVTVAAIDKNGIVVVQPEEEFEEFEEAVDFCPREILGQILEEIIISSDVLEEEKPKEEIGMFGKLDFGKVNTEQFRLSINGLAVRGKDSKYQTFNPETRELIEVTTGFFDDMKDLLFIMPATGLEVGDVILHQNKPYFITEAGDTVRGIDYEDAIESVLVPKTNVFGMKYYTKVFNCLGSNNILGNTDIASNPMMLYGLMGGNDFDISKLMMFQAMSGQGKGVADFSENPMMLMALMSNEKGGSDISNFAKMQMLSSLTTQKKETKKPTRESKEN